MVSCWRERPGSLPNMSRDQGIRGYLPGNILDMIVTIGLTLRLLPSGYLGLQWLWHNDVFGIRGVFDY